MVKGLLDSLREPGLRTAALPPSTRFGTISVRVSTNPTLTIGKPQSLFSSEQLGFWSGIPTYDVTSDGQRFVVPERAQAAVAGTDGQDGDPPRPSIRVVQNWYQEFRRRKQD